MPKEIETKFKIESDSAFRKKIKRIGAVFVCKRFEKDIYYRNLSNLRQHQDMVIRLRSFGNKGIFTIKTVIPGMKSRLYKIREELQTAIDDVKTFGQMLGQLGFVPHFRKEKVREVYKWKDAEISIDELPFIGFYAEIEAPKSRIKKLASLLGLDMAKATSDTYMELFNYYKIIHKKPKLELVFPKIGTAPIFLD